MIESLGIIPLSQKAYNEKNSKENKNQYTDIICTSSAPYFPSYFLGCLKEIYVDKLDYMVGMKDFECLFNELNINDKYIPRNNKIYSVLNKEVLNNIKALTNKEIKIISDYTNRIESSLYTTVGFDFYVLHHLQQYHIQDIFPIKKEPTKTSKLDNFIISGSMSRFDRLFHTLGKYQAYKEYTNSVISEKGKLLNEIYDKFILC